MSPTLKLRRRLFRLLSQLNLDSRSLLGHPGGPFFRAGTVLLATAFVGTDPTRLAETTGYEPDFCGRILKRARTNKVLHGNRLRAKWMEADSGDLAFMLDCMVTVGSLTRSPSTEIQKAASKQRHARIAAGQCSSCGRARDLAGKVCSKCREAQKRSAEKSKTRDLSIPAGVTSAKVEPYYGLSEWSKRPVTQEAGAAEEVAAASGGRDGR